MTADDKYDDLFAETAPDDSVFADKAALDPLAAPDEIVARDDQERKLAGVLNGVQSGYLPTTVSIYGPPGAGKTLTTRRVCREFAARHHDVAVEYVNLKECRTLFSTANEICFAVTGEKRGAYEGLDGVFTAIWDALESYPAWTVLLLDEIDHIEHDSNYDPSDFFYRLLRGEGKLQRDIELSVWIISNELREVDLRVDSRVQSVMSGEEVFFPPYGYRELKAICRPRVDRAFRDGAVPEDVFQQAVRQAAQRWGDARKALRLFRQAGEAADERGLEAVTTACLDACLESTEREATIETLCTLPLNHFLVLVGSTAYTDPTTQDVRQPVTTAEIQAALERQALPFDVPGRRAIRDLVQELETMDLVATWIDSKGRDGRVKQIETAFDPTWVHDAMVPYAMENDSIDLEALDDNTAGE
jgi:orc1/cdc6 family replication initiation protein